MTNKKLNEAYGRFNAGDVAGAERLCNEVLAVEPGNGDAFHLLGIMCIVGGRPDTALGFLKRAVAIKSGDARVLENLGVANLATNHFVDAEAAFRGALGAGGPHGLLQMRLGLAVGAQGRHEEAITLLRAAADQLPDDPDVQVNLGNALAEAARFEESITCFEKVLNRYPSHADTRFNLGTVFRRLGRLDEAERCFQQVLQQVPGYADAHASLGMIEFDRGHLDGAIANYRRALEIEPKNLQALINLSNTLVRKDLGSEAELYLQRALAISPNDSDSLINLGNLRAKQGRSADAQLLYERAARTETGAVDAFRNLGKLFRGQGRYADAFKHLRSALERMPENPGTMVDLGATCLETGDLTQAEAWYRKALAVEPANAATCRELADVLKMWGRYDEAARNYERALELQNDCLPALGGLIYVRQHMSDWTGIEALWARARHEAIGRPGSGITPFSILAQPTTSAEQLACARAWTQSEVAPIASQRTQLAFDFDNRRARPARLRVGYLSWDFHQHATSYLIAELFELHDRNRFEIFAFSYGPDDGSAIRARIRSAADGFIDIQKNSHALSARAIYDNRIDVLVDLKGYTQGARPQIMALRPAPVQVNWLGYPGSMGMEQIDAIIADPFVIPEGAEAGFSERVMRLPDCYQINDRHRQVGARPARDACGLPVDGFVFCCFNQSYKILPDVFAAWMRVLKAVPGSVLWLLETNAWAVENLRRSAAAQGVSAERLVFAPIRPLADHLARYRVADLALDTFPYTSHTTGSDALWSGCPLVTCAGDTFASRVAGSLLHAAGLSELVTDTPADCERLAIELASSPSRLAEIRSRLVAGRETCALFDSPRFVHNLEQAFDALWVEWAGRGGG